MLNKYYCSRFLCYTKADYIIENKCYCYKHMISKCNKYKKDIFLHQEIIKSYNEKIKV